MTDKKNILHIIPAAGKATRFGGIQKFLLPISTNNFLIKFHVDNLKIKNCNIKKVIAVSNEYYKTIKRMDLDADILKLETKTMNETVLEVIKKYKNFDNYLLSMPDSFFDMGIVDTIYKEYLKKNSLCTLGLFKIQNFQKGKLGQCSIKNNNVVKVVDKDEECDFEHAWGVMMWNKKLNNLIKKDDPHTGYILNPAIKNKISINYAISTNQYYDCGTFEEYKELLKEPIIV